MKIELSEKIQYPCTLKMLNSVSSNLNLIIYTKIINNIIVFCILKKHYKKIAKRLLTSIWHVIPLRYNDPFERNVMNEYEQGFQLNCFLQVNSENLRQAKRAQAFALRWKKLSCHILILFFTNIDLSVCHCKLNTKGCKCGCK